MTKTIVLLTPPQALDIINPVNREIPGQPTRGCLKWTFNPTPTSR
jgi:hypothetical protein